MPLVEIIIIVIGFLVLSLLILHRTKPRKSKVPAEAGKMLEDQIEYLLQQNNFKFERLSKSRLQATPDFLVTISDTKLGLDGKNVSTVKSLDLQQARKMIDGCEKLNALPIFVTDEGLEESEVHGITILPIDTIVPFMNVLKKVERSVGFDDEAGIKMSIEDILRHERTFLDLFSKLKSARERFSKLEKAD